MDTLTAPRAVAMRSRVLRRYEYAGASAEAIALLDACLSAALALRERHILDEEDPRFLHPARTVLILLDDAAVTAPALLGAAALVESEESGLAPDAELLARLPEAASAQARRVPVSRMAGERLTEALLEADRETRLIACAERLDLARHAHILPGFDGVRWLREARDLYQPLATRTDALLATRFDRWSSALERRLQRH